MFAQQEEQEGCAKMQEQK